MNIIYMMDITVYGAKHQVLVNDIPVSRDFSGTPMNAEFPINELLINLKSEILIELFPVPDQSTLQRNSEVSVSVRKNTIVNNQKESIVIFEHEKKVNDLTGLALYKFDSIFEVLIFTNPPLWSYNKIIDITESSTLQRIYSSFHDIYNLFNSKQITEILQQFNKKLANYEDCYGLERGNRYSVTMAKLQDTLKNPNFELVGFDLSIFMPQLYGHGKLITLLDKEGYNFVMYYNDQESILVEFPIYLGISNNNEIYISL
jgi:hypothetical protein